LEITNCDIQSVRENGAAPRPLVFTQEGGAMLSAVLCSDRAVQMSIAIVRTFVRMRELMEANKNIAVCAKCSQVHNFQSVFSE
jgi:hypothetical protein